MYSKLKLSELKNTNFKTKHHFFYKIVKVLEVANFTFLANFRFLTLTSFIYFTICAKVASGEIKSQSTIIVTKITDVSRLFHKSLILQLASCYLEIKFILTTQL